MSRINLGAGIVNYPMPVTVVGAKVDSKPNFLTVAWVSMVSYNPPRIAVTLGNSHYTNKGIKENKRFSVCFPSTSNIEKADYVGLVSGKNEDKSNVFDLFYGESDLAPMIEEFPLNVECKLESVIESGKNEIFIGDIVGIHAEEKILTNGKVDIAKLDPIILGQINLEYRSVGENIGRAWSIGRNYSK